MRTLPGVPTRFENVDLVIVRENTEDLYKGIEYMLNDEIANGVKLITKPPASASAVLPLITLPPTAVKR